MTERELLDLKAKITTAKNKATGLRGQRDYLMQQLADDWECKTVKEAEAKVKQFDADIAKLDKKIEEGIAEIEELGLE
jgi:hypothetical protein